MQFCSKCGTLLAPKDGDDSVFTCEQCGTEEKLEGDAFMTSEKQERTDDVVVLDENQTTNPVTKAHCEKCENKKAEYWIEQTRSADEAPTRFYKCTKCKHTWREYS